MQTDVQADIQRANMWRRGAAWALDLILLAVIAAGMMFLLSSVLDYDHYSTIVNDAYIRYEEEYGVTFELTPEAYMALSAEEQQKWDIAYDALVNDPEAMQAYKMTVNLILIMTTGGILIATILLQIVVPLLLKNGQTVGKKAFGLGVIRQDGVKMNHLQLFVRAILGKFTIETMIPVYIVLMILWGSIGMIGPGILLILLMAQCISMRLSMNNSAIHDLISGTVVVDLAMQKVFNSSEELVEYTKKLHAERAARQDY